MQQQGFPMVPVMQANMPGMMGMNYGSQMPPGPMAMQVCGTEMWTDQNPRLLWVEKDIKDHPGPGIPSTVPGCSKIPL